VPPVRYLPDVQRCHKASENDNLSIGIDDLLAKEQVKVPHGELFEHHEAKKKGPRMNTDKTRMKTGEIGQKGWPALSRICFIRVSSVFIRGSFSSSIIGSALAQRPERRRTRSLDGKLGTRENGRMKTTLDLPDALVKQVKIRAVREGRKLKDAVADLLRKGLASPQSPPTPTLKSPRIITDPETGLPLIVCKQAAAPDEEMTPQRVADILLAQEVEWHHAAGR
jgi:plasmid stability protein